MAADLICCVCDEPNGLFRTLMTREHPVCDRCYIAWYEGAGTDRDSIRAALKLDAPAGVTGSEQPRKGEPQP